MYEVPHLLAEYDRARAYTDELWRDLTAEELHWRPERNFSPIGEVRNRDLGHALPDAPTSDRLTTVDGYLVVCGWNV
ncbi:hypothetical protein GCM10010140_60980 [Streptosporangium pseudovulgare]|uniref:Uncharacterized protein n=2 Tax=Streptosporangium pseudovulgare TaxID=35765 RepID=A0ABQ2RBB1_9ACTN|nr:hypothetical protein GCM10010140_60980 [Streptosporangium pseudovulgare]